MRHWKIWLYLSGVTAIIVSCIIVSYPGEITIPSAPAQKELASQTTLATQYTPSVAKATITSAAAATNAPTQQPTVTEIAAADQVDQCIECHTEKEKLIDTADPVEEVVEESEGAG
jgi:hypothetical protein